MTKYYYKVTNNWFASAIMHNASMKVQYKLNEWAYPQLEHSKLYVFKTLDDAKAFTSGSPYSNPPNAYVIFKCEVKQPSKCTILAKWFSRTDMQYICKCRQRKKKVPLSIRHSIPNGTIQCNAVKLIERVYY